MLALPTAPTIYRHAAIERDPIRLNANLGYYTNFVNLLGGIEVEVWELTAAGFGSLVAAVPAPLAVGTVTLEDGERVKGFLCEAHAVQGAEDISAWGGWRAYRASPGGSR